MFRNSVKLTRRSLLQLAGGLAFIGRPVDVHQMKDGSLLVSDDWNGAVYRITYGKPKVASK